ncbi:CPCC family cysteine-rich protein [Parapedobacter tibetensis]|uniref:CPCC family cysteine-rich protein n=1 Tax=Parapedobacter tibetensis TaxID=2972951 RepID=UPI00214D47FF|nr:CPCC family cysteine-rich protein [Parapedobacter tibetensis]
MDTNIINKYKCPCCGYYTLDQRPDNTFQICPVCYWEDDGVQLNDSDYEGGANRVSLNEAKRNFEKFGAIEKGFINQVRPPNKDEMKD